MNLKGKTRAKGSSLIVVILVIAFLLAVGAILVTVTGTGTKVSANVRSQDEAFNAAEAGFDAARMAIEQFFLDGTWINFDDNCLREPAGIDLPQDDGYFRRRTDEELLLAINPANPGVIFYNQPYVSRSGGLDPRYTYTVFMIDDEAGGGIADPSGVLLICIGVVRAGNRIVSTSRLEIVMGVEPEGTNP